MAPGKKIIRDELHVSGLHRVEPDAFGDVPNEQ
jgi:hypothetical protein